MSELALVARLSGFSALTALIGGAAPRIYPLILPQTPTLPALTYERISTVRESAMGLDTGICRARYQVTIWAETYQALLAVRDQLRAALQRFRGTSAGVTVQDIFLENEQAFYEDDPKPSAGTGLFHLPIDAQLIFTET